MFLAIDEVPVVLLGPKPPIAPSGWEAHWPFALLALIVIGGLTIASRQWRRRRPSLPAIIELEKALLQAEARPGEGATREVTTALRTYRAAIDTRVAASLSTEELSVRISGLAVFLPARQPLLAALRSADAAKFAGTPVELPLLLAGVREAAQRIEDARRTFGQLRR